MSKHPSTPHAAETPATSIELKLCVGLVALAILQFVFLALVWAISGWQPALSPSHWMHQGWLEFVRQVRIVFALLAAGLILVGGYLVIVALGDRLITAWRWWRHSR